jgi:type IV pilus assembly protein PilQ
VPWEQALDTILKSRNYDKVRTNNIIRIASAEQIQKEKERELAKKKADIEVGETIVRMIGVNYAIAKEIVDQLKPILSPRGSLQVDERTNTIIAQDLRENIERIIELTKRLDRQTPQVLIEARIVEASTNFVQELGIQWGGTGQATTRNGNPTGLVFPGDVIAAGATDDNNTVTTGTGNPGRFAVNLPAAIGTGSGAGIGFIFGSAGGSQLLNLRLSALENNGSGRIVSSPRIATLDNRPAKIQQGVDIPVSTVSAAGTNTRFVPANLELDVTPHVTNDGTVLLRIKTSKNEPDFANRGASGDPTIVRKYAETEVMVRDGDTSVIGGIYTRNTSENFSEVPFFSKIPVLGWLFKKKRNSDVRAELLVFITPRIVNREAALMADASSTRTSNGATRAPAPAPAPATPPPRNEALPAAPEGPESTPTPEPNP